MNSLALETSTHLNTTSIIGTNMPIKKRKICKVSRPAVRTWQGFEKYAESYEVAHDFPHGRIIKKPVCIYKGKEATFPDTVIKTGNFLDREAVVDYKFKKQLTKKDIEKIVRDAECRDARFPIPPLGIFRGVGEKILYANKDIKIPRYVEEFAKEKGVTIQLTCVSKYHRKNLAEK